MKHTHESQRGFQRGTGDVPSRLYSLQGYAHNIMPEKNTISIQMVNALSPSAIFVAVQYLVALITRPSRASNCAVSTRKGTKLQS